MGVNVMSEDLQEASHLSVKSPLNVPSEQRHRVRIVPHGMNYYKDPRRIITPIYTGINYPVGIDQLKRKEDLIRKHFKVDFFLMLAETERQMTATEIIERQSEKAAVLGAMIGRLQDECLNPIIDRVFRIEYEAGRLPKIPESLIPYGGRGLRVDYMGPLAQAQKRLHKTQGVLHTLEALQGLLALKPDIADNIDWDIVAREIMDSHGFPQNAIRDPELVRLMREQREKMLAEQAQLEQTQQMAEAMPKLSRKIEEGSPLEHLMRAGVGAGAS